MRLDEKTGIVILATGGPATADEVPGFLLELFSDPLHHPLPWLSRAFRRPIARRRAAAATGRLRAAMEAVALDVPLQRVCAAQADGLAARLGGEGYVAMRFGQPSAAATVELMRAEGMRSAVLLGGEAAHAVEDGRDAFARAWKETGGAAPDLLHLEDWRRDGGVIGAMAAILGETTRLLRGGSGHVLFLGGAVPSHPRAGEERRRTEALAAELARRVELETPWSVAWPRPLCGRAGLEPAAPDAVEELARAGVRDLALVPVGFTADCLDTLFGLDVELLRAARDRGVRTYRAATVNDDDRFLGAVADVVRRRAEPVAAGERA